MLGNQRRCLGLPVNGFKLAVEGVLYIAHQFRRDHRTTGYDHFHR